MSEKPIAFMRAIAESLQDSVKRRIGMRPFQCYVCGEEAMTYNGCLVIPPDPMTILKTEDLMPVSVCGKPYCRMMEQKRQDAIIQHILESQRIDYLRRRAEEVKGDKKK